MTSDTVSIEKVLNSRCSSDFDVGRKKRHWGTLLDRHPPQHTIDRILRSCNTPRFSSGKLLQWFENRNLFLGFEEPDDPDVQRLLHIESGMQHQAVYLTTTALGVGTCIYNEGIDGTKYGEKLATGRHMIMEMTDPYGGRQFSTKTPGPERPFKTGKHLAKPSREGDMECMPQLEHLRSFSKSGPSASAEDISQLLWAARGRTPHHIRLHVWNAFWGLTIPTWGGRQNITSVYLVRDDRLFRYVNWTRNFTLVNRILMRYAKWVWGKPTHDIAFVRNMKIRDELNGAETAIILCQNEKTSRALWEVGYMLENIFLQARGLGISYQSRLFTSREVSQLAGLGLANAVSAVLL